MKKIVLSLLAIVFLMAGFTQSTMAAESRVIKVGAFNNYPLILKDTNGDISGFYVDLLSEIGKKENITFQYVIGTWNEGLERIKTGEVDMLTSVGYTDERSTYMDFTKNPVLTVWGELYADKSTDIKGILDVENRKIGVMRGDINAENFSELISKFELRSQIVEFESYDDLFVAVEKKEVEAGVAGLTFGMGNAAKYNLKSTGIVFNPIGLYFATAKGKNEELILTFDKYLLQWRNEDKSFFDVSKQKWMGVTIEKVVVPTWFWYVLLGLGVMFLISLIFVVLLKQQVNRAIKKNKLESDELKKSDEKWQQLFERSNDALATIEPPDWKFTLINQSTMKLFDAVNKNEILLHTPFGLSPEKQPGGRSSDKMAKEYIEKALKDKLVEFEWTHTKVNGKTFLANVILTVIEIGGKTVLQATMRDVTESKRTQEELIKSKAELQSKVGELEKFQKLTIDRELKMAELKEDIEEMKKK